MLAVGGGEGEKRGRLAANGLAEVAGVAAVVPKISKVPGVSEVAAEVPEVSEAHSGGPQHFNIHSQGDADEAIQVSDKAVNSESYVEAIKPEIPLTRF